MKIPLNKPFWGKKEEQAAVTAIRTTLGAGEGPFNRKLEQALKSLTGVKYALAVTSCTHGLELAMAAMDIGPGDEVIVPSFTMTSTANCVVLRGATPVFADIDPVSFNIDPLDIRRKVTRRTRGIIVVHYAGMPCRMEEIGEIARKHKLFVVEDAAHAIGSAYRGRMLGTWSDIGVYSFHGTKNISCGEGGAVLTDRKDLAEAMEIYRANGTNRKAFLEGVVDKYSWVGKGTSYYLSDILASIALAQIFQITKINKQRQQIASLYTSKLSDYHTSVTLPSVPPQTIPNWHIYAIRFKDEGSRRFFIKAMRKEGVEVAPHYVPLHGSRMGKTLHGSKPGLPVTESVASTLVRMPIYPGLTKTQLSYIIASARRALERL